MATAYVILEVHIDEGDIPEEFFPNNSQFSQDYKKFCKLNDTQLLFSGTNYNLTEGFYSIWISSVKINYDNMNQPEPGDYWQVQRLKKWLTIDDEPRGTARILGMRIGEKLIEQGYEKE